MPIEQAPESGPGPLEAVVGQFPRYFRHRCQVESDCVYVRHDDADSAVVVTRTGERRPNAPKGWPIGASLLMVAMGQAEEITADQAAAMIH